VQALTAMVRGLRSGNGQNGLILANGGVLTYQHALCLGTQPRRNESAYPDTNPLPRYVTDLPIPRISAQAEGEAIIEVGSGIIYKFISTGLLTLLLDLHGRI